MSVAASLPTVVPVGMLLKERFEAESEQLALTLMPT
jgi:hypothetical protein